MAADVPSRREGRSAGHGQGESEIRLRDQGRAARAVVDGGMSKPEAMERFGVASISPLESWCRRYREGGAEALRSKPKGRPRREATPVTREEELEREVRRLEAQVAYLKNRALVLFSWVVARR